MKQKGHKSGGESEAKREQPLQAVLLAADTFSAEFRPLSLDKPKCLCPLNNVALIDYTMDYLVGAGVEELFVVCTSDQVERHVLDWKQSATGSSSLQISVIKDSILNTAGDALRELDKQNVVQSDPFILMFADVVSNVDLNRAIRAHKERHKNDSSALMTMVLKEIEDSPTKSSIHSNIEDLIVGIDPTHDNRVMYYDKNPSRKSAALPCSFFASCAEIEVRSDLLECGISLCSPDLLARFSDNFDYGDIYGEFVANSVAEEEEGLQNRVFAHLLKSNQRPNEYAARVHDFFVYANISRDILTRWCYPVVPDHHRDWRCRYKMQRHYLYYDTSNARTRVGRSSVVTGPGMVGQSSFIGEHCTISECVVGSFCHIGDRCVLARCHIWNNANIGDNVEITESIIAEGVTVKSGSVINRGCVIGAGCVIDHNAELPPFTWLTLREEKDDDFDDDWDGDDDSESGGSKQNDAAAQVDAPKHSESHVVGPTGKGRVWQPKQDDEFDHDIDDEIWLPSLQEKIHAQSIGYDVTALIGLRCKYDEESRDNLSDVDDRDEGMLGGFDDDYGGAMAFTIDDPRGVPTVSTNDDIVGRQKGIDVLKELTAICMEYEDTSPIENLAIELNSFKFSQNATYSDCVIAATTAIIQRMGIIEKVTDGRLVSLFRSSLERWAPLLQKMSISIEEEKAVVVALERCATEDTFIGGILSKGMSFRLFLQTLHDYELVSEDAILAWAEERKEEGDTARGRLFRMQPVQEFIDWLQQDSADEDSTDDGSDED